MANADKFGPLIGAIDEGTSSARFLVRFFFILEIHLLFKIALFANGLCNINKKEKFSNSLNNFM